MIHFIDKSGAGWFPQKPKNKRKVSIRDHPEVPTRKGLPKRYQSLAPGYVKIYEEVEKKEVCATRHKQDGVFQSLVYVNHSPTMALIDTGASASFISADLVQRLGIATQRKKHAY
jgi:predicted aspartyl protease